MNVTEQRTAWAAVLVRLLGELKAAGWILADALDTHHSQQHNASGIAYWGNADLHLLLRYMQGLHRQ